MHELSLAMSILDAASKELGEDHTCRVQEIQLEVGMLSGVDAEALKFALVWAVKSTILEEASVVIISTEGIGRCFQCDLSFRMTDVWTPCPTCSQPAGKILQGTELKLLSLTVDDGYFL